MSWDIGAGQQGGWDIGAAQAAAATGDISGTILGAAAVSGSLAAEITGTVLGAATVAGVLSAELTGTILGEAIMSGALSADLAATVLGFATVAGGLSSGLAGTVQGAATTIGGLSAFMSSTSLGLTLLPDAILIDREAVGQISGTILGVTTVTGLMVQPGIILCFGLTEQTIVMDPLAEVTVVMEPLTEQTLTFGLSEQTVVMDTLDEQTVALGASYSSPGPNWNIIEFLMDDVGIDMLSVYDTENAWAPGYAYPATPNIDAIAGIGVRFLNAWAHPVCSPDRAAVQTGKLGLITPKHTFGTGIGFAVNLNEPAPFTAGMFALPFAHVDQDTTYEHFHIGKWHLGDGQDDQLAPILDGGLTEYRGCLTNANKHQSNTPANNYVGDYTDWTLTLATPSNLTTARHTTGQLAARERFDFAQILPSDLTPFVMRVWFHHAHSPFDLVVDALLDLGTATMPETEQEPNATSNPFNNHNVIWRRAKAMIEAIDNSIGIMLGNLTAAQKLNTIVIVRSDNGSDGNFLTPLGTIPEPPNVYDPNHAKQTVYEQGIKVPLIIGAHPDNATPDWVVAAMRGATTNALASTVDVWATMAEATIANWQVYQTDGNSLLPILAGTATNVSEFVFSESFRPNGAAWADVTQGEIAVRDQAGFKLIRRNAGADEFYDVSVDPLETSDLFSGLPTNQAEYDALDTQLVALGVDAP